MYLKNAIVRGLNETQLDDIKDERRLYLPYHSVINLNQLENVEHL